jgi:cobalamin biosynthesis protein CobD/CbiB
MSRMIPDLDLRLRPSGEPLPEPKPERKPIGFDKYWQVFWGGLAWIVLITGGFLVAAIVLFIAFVSIWAGGFLGVMILLYMVGKADI